MTNAGGTRTTYAYDNNGNLSTTQVAAGTTTNTYDYENRVLTVTLPAPATTTFTYNGEGKRLTKVDSSGTIKYLYDQSKVAIERDVSNNNLATYTHEGGSLYYDLISMERTNSYWYLFDGLGSVTELVDSDEDTQNSYRYEAFGQIKSSSENVTNYYKYVGAFGVHHDSALALYFMQARYYNAAIGRFITMDPLPGAPQDPPSLHRYLYSCNNPVTWIDPSGLGFVEWWSGTVIPWLRNVFGWVPTWARLGSAGAVGPALMAYLMGLIRATLLLGPGNRQAYRKQVCFNNYEEVPEC